MSQTLIDISKMKDYDSARAVDALAQVVSDAGFVSGGLANPLVVGTAAHKVTVTGATSLITAVASGTDSAIDFSIQSKSTGVVALGGTTVASASVQIPVVSSSVNFVKLSGAATGVAVEVLGTGTDSTVDIALRPKSTGSVWVGGASTAAASVKIPTVASSVNQFVLTSGATGTAPVLSVGGASADTNRDLVFQGAGTGAARLKGGSGAVAAPVGYVGEILGDKVFGTGTTATVTITIATPGVITWTAHSFSTTVPQPVVFTTTIALPTGITSGTVYYTSPGSVTTNTFSISSTVANAIAGTLIATSGSQSGTQTGTAGCVLANTTAADVCGMALTAGDWDVWGQVSWNTGSTTTWTTLETSISQTTATLASSGAVRGTSYLLQAQISAAATNGVATAQLPHTVINVSSTTNIFLVAKCAFAISTHGAYGFIMARRRA